MKVTILKSVRMSGAPSVAIQPGSIVVMPDNMAVEWIKSGHASAVPLESAMEKAVLLPAEMRSAPAGAAVSTENVASARPASVKKKK